MDRQEKNETVDTLVGELRSISSAFLIDYHGLKVVDADDLRRKVRSSGGKYVVVKNTLALRATKDTKLAALREHFAGPTAVAYHPTDVVGLAKLLNEITK